MSDDQLPRLGLFMLAPLLALVLIAVNAIGQIVDANDRLVSGQALNAFTSQAAEALDALQGERANAAVVLRNIAPGGRQQYRQSWQRTDALMADLIAPATDTSVARFSAQTGSRLEALTAGLDDLRAAVLSEAISLEEGVNGYSAMITGFIEALAAQFEALDEPSMRFAEAFLDISMLHERVAVEAGTGLTAFYSGQIDPEAHALFIGAVAPQDLLASRFSALAGPTWRDALSSTLAGAADAELEEARNTIIAAGYTEERVVDQSHRTWWRETRLPVYFALGELRNQYAVDGLPADMEAAREQRTRATRNALLQILALLLASAASLYGLVSLIKPDDQAERV